MIKIGIDLASQNSGIVILDENNSYLAHKHIKLKSFKEKDINILLYKLKSELKHFFNDYKYQQAQIIIEKNVRHQTLTLFLGIWIAILDDIFENKTIKMIDPWIWYKKIEGTTHKDTRELRKATAKAFTLSKLKDIANNWEEDIYDAYCITYYGNKENK